MVSATRQYIDTLEVHASFEAALLGGHYEKLPSDWMIAVTDVVASRRAIEAGQYKSVNMAGVAMISAVMNALDDFSIPYIFGGDGAAIAFAPQEEPIVRQALAKTVNWVKGSIGLNLRAAIVPVQKVEDDGFDVKLAAVSVSKFITNYAFLGGGISHAENLMKNQQYLIDCSHEDALPDLSGLSCRWTPVETAGRKVVSLIVSPTSEATNLDPEISRQLLTMVGDVALGHPMPSEGPGFKWPPKGLNLEAEASKGAGSLAKQKLLLYLITAIAWVLDRTGWPLGKFDPVRYREMTSVNTDFRKLQDGLKMTICAKPDQIDRLETYLAAQQAHGNLRYGISVQDRAVLTCFVPSIMSDSHFHFLDGAGGGYALAATNMQKAGQ